MSFLDDVGLTRRGRLRAQRARARLESDAHVFWRWSRACEGAGFVQRVDTVTGTTIVTPRIEKIDYGPPTVLLVELLPGQLLSDLADVARRIAPALGARRLRLRPCGDMRVQVELLTTDPLDVDCRAPEQFLTSGTDNVFGGINESGLPVSLSWASAPHTIVQGVTRSGKSWWIYNLLSQLASPKDVLLCGSDPSGLIWRPFQGSRHARFQVSGLKDPEEHVKLMQTLVTEMDRRVTSLPHDSDSLLTDTTNPLLVVVLEEYPGLLRAVDNFDTKLGKQLRALVSRLLAEGHKVGIRVIIITQRAEANIIGGFERANCSLRISFRADNRDAVKLLHPDAAAEQCDDHMSAEPGIALLTAPGVPLARFRAPWIGRYANYVQMVHARLAV